MFAKNKRKKKKRIKNKSKQRKNSSSVLFPKTGYYNQNKSNDLNLYTVRFQETEIYKVSLMPKCRKLIPL